MANVCLKAARDASHRPLPRRPSSPPSSACVSALSVTAEVSRSSALQARWPLLRAHAHADPQLYGLRAARTAGHLVSRARSGAAVWARAGSAKSERFRDVQLPRANSRMFGAVAGRRSRALGGQRPWCCAPADPCARGGHAPGARPARTLCSRGGCGAAGNADRPLRLPTPTPLSTEPPPRV
jgi:hypothetical protein